MLTTGLSSIRPKGAAPDPHTAGDHIFGRFYVVPFKCLVTTICDGAVFCQNDIQCPTKSTA